MAFLPVQGRVAAGSTGHVHCPSADYLTLHCRHARQAVVVCAGAASEAAEAAEVAGLQAAASADGRRSVFLYTVQPQVAPLAPVLCCAVTGVSPGRSGQSCQRFLQCVIHSALVCIKTPWTVPWLLLLPWRDVGHPCDGAGLDATWFACRPPSCARAPCCRRPASRTCATPSARHRCAHSSSGLHAPLICLWWSAEYAMSMACLPAVEVSLRKGQFLRKI